MRSSDVIAASTPTVAALTLGEINTLVGIAGGVLGILYLLWRWRKEYRQRTPLD